MLEHSQSSLENDLYRHPEVSCHFGQSGTKYRKCHDLYSLGIVFLEIGLWKRVHLLWKDHYSHEGFRPKWLESYVSQLGPKMGAIYREVVRILVSMELDSDTNEQSCEQNPENGPGSEMYWRVIRELEKCNA